jgi:hypothetical protein
MPESLINKLSITRSDVSHQRFLYGIKPLPGVKDSKQDVVYRPFQMVYEIGYVKKASAIPEPLLFVGFYGFNYPVIARLDTLWSRPADTTIQPCVHNLLADVFVNSYESFETSDPQPCKLLVFDLSKNTRLAEQIALVTPIPASAKDLFYLFWDTRVQPELPAGFSEPGMTEMNVTRPVKIPKSKMATAVADAKPIPPPPVAIKEPKPVPPPVAIKKEVPPANAISGQTVKPKEQVKSLAPAISFTRAPDISQLLYPDLWEYAIKQSPSLDQNDIILKLSKKNDSLIAFSKSRNEVSTVFLLPVKSYPVSLRPAENGFPEELTSATVKSSLLKNLRSVKFGYKGQELFFADDKINTILQIPSCFSNRMEIKGNWDKPATLNWSGTKDSGFDTLFVALEKIPLRLTIVDEKTGSPVNGCMVTVRVQGKIINSLNFNSTGDIEGLYRLESVYQVSVQHDDYYSKSPFLSKKDFDAGKTITLINQPAFDVFYVATASELKNQMITSVERKFESVKQLKQPFLLFLSNTDRPFVTSDEKSVQGIINKIPQLFDDVPNLVTDYERFNKELRAKPLPPNAKVNLSFYMSKDVFQSQGKAFIDKVVYSYRDIFKVEASVNIYLDTEITEQITANKNKDDKKPNENYHYYSLLNQ